MRILTRTPFASCVALLLLSNFVSQVSADETKGKSEGVADKSFATKRPAEAKTDQNIPEINLLDAKRQGLVSVAAEGRGDGRMTISVTNRTRRALRVVLPPGIIAQSATGQFGGMGGMGGGMGGMGGGMGGMGGGMGGMGGMGGGMGGGFPSPEDVTDRGNAPAFDRATGGANRSGTAAARSGAADAPVAGIASSGKEAVDLAQRLAELKTGARAETSTTQRTVAGRPFQKVGGAWVDQAFKPSMPTLRLRVLGKAYFRLLARHPELSPIFAMGNRVTWVSPGGTALVIDNQGQDEATDSALVRLFTPAR
jgi:hypothetical protein